MDTLRLVPMEYVNGWGFGHMLFVDRPAYLVQMLLDEADTVELKPSWDAAKDEKPEERWRLLVLEDTGEMMTMDAKEHVGQALSRLLNVTDGLIDQGMRLLVLVTTNEDIGKLHPAVARPGRCAARINFAEFAAEEANHWLSQHGDGFHVNVATSLAELYALVGGYAQPREQKRVGFLGAGE